MDENLRRLEDKLDKVSDSISSIDVTLGKQSVSLEEHIRRTELLEERMKPVEAHVIFISGMTKLILAIATVAGAVAAILEWLH